ncbi:MAG: CDP-diacylglycerol--serine O-phosphatidyltransferase [Vicinamibacterales bacterium]
MTPEELINVRARSPERPPAVLRRGAYLLPSVFTMANMFCGYACIVHAMRGDHETAAPYIGFAIVLDMLDGRIARLTGSTSAFGLEFDSLADVISFGVAPAVLAFSWGLTPFGRLGWAAGFIFVAAAAIRLARFNIQTTGIADKRYFVGMPSPAAAGVPAATVFAYPYGLQDWYAVLALPMVLVPAFLMVSTIRYRSFKTFDLRSPRSYRNLILLATIMAAIATHPQWTLVVLAYTYLLSAFLGGVVSPFRRSDVRGKVEGASTDSDVQGQPDPH